ncbi:MAG: hypothetical protein ABI633_10655 [Burkholderiales bacterium]
MQALDAARSVELKDIAAHRRGAKSKRLQDLALDLTVTYLKSAGETPECKRLKAKH